MSVKYCAPKGLSLLTPFLFCWIREMASGRKNQKLSHHSMMNVVGKNYVCISRSCGFIIQAQKSLWNILIADIWACTSASSYPGFAALGQEGQELELFLPSTVHPGGKNCEKSSPPRCSGSSRQHRNCSHFSVHPLKHSPYQMSILPQQLVPCHTAQPLRKITSALGQATLRLPGDDALVWCALSTGKYRKGINQLFLFLLNSPWYDAALVAVTNTWTLTRHFQREN